MRLRLRTRVRVVTSALVNSGFETDTPQLVLQLPLARRLNLWSRALLEGRVQVYGTVAGPTRLYVVLSSIEVSSRRSLWLWMRWSLTVRGGSDCLAGALGIIIEDLRDGLMEGEV